MGYENAHTTGIWQEIEREQITLSMPPSKPKAGIMTNDKTAAGPLPAWVSAQAARPCMAVRIAAGTEP